MGEYAVDKRDIKFVLFEHLPLRQLFELERYAEHSFEDYEMILDEAIRFAGEVLSPLNAPMDRDGFTFEDGQVKFPEAFKQAARQFAEGGWISVGNNLEWGGSGMPEPISIATHEIFHNANCSFSLTPSLTRGAARLIEAFGTDEQKATYCEKMYTGQWAGTMCLTEPQAGSDLAALKTTAVPEGDHYKITGNKIFISSGDHDFAENIVHLLIGRVEGAPPGTKGISLFVVPKFIPNADGTPGKRNDVACVGVEHKMGIHASPTASLAFGENEECIGWLVGTANRGLAHMFQMMNEARVDVGVQGLGLAGAAYEAAKAFAVERLQGADMMAGKGEHKQVPIIRHPDVRRNLMEMKAKVEGCRALIYTAAFHEDLSHRAKTPEEREKHARRIELLTPMAKAYPTDEGFHVTALGVQVHGGYGYCQEYPAEQYLRDCKIASIYEGTNGIQAMDLLGRKVLAQNGIRCKEYFADLEAFLATAKDSAFGDLAGALDKAKDALGAATMSLAKRAGGGDVKGAFVAAVPFLKTFAEVVISHLLLEQALLAHARLSEMGGLEASRSEQKDKSELRFYHGKIASARWYLTQQLPHAIARSKAIQAADVSPLNVVF